MKGFTTVIGRNIPSPRVTACVVVAAAMTAVVWQWYLDRQTVRNATSAAEAPVPVTARERSQSPESHVRTAIALNLMGAPKEAPVIVDTPPVVIPQTTLQLRLAGSFASPNKALAAALIDVDGNGSRYFRVGDAITGDVALYAVATDSITLKRKDGFEKLYFAGAAPTDAVQEAVAAVDQASGTIPRTPQPAVGTAAVTSAAVAVVTPSASAFLPGDLTLSERLTRLRAAQRQTQ